MYIIPIAEVISQVIGFKVLFLTQGRPTKSVFYKYSVISTYLYAPRSKQTNFLITCKLIVYDIPLQKKKCI